MERVPEHAGMQGRLVRPRSDRRGPVVPLLQAVLRLQHPAGQDAAERPHLDVRLRHDPRPRRERRGEQPSGRRAGGDSLWGWCKTSTEYSGPAADNETETLTAQAV